MIVVKDLHHAFAKPVLEGISFSVEPGEVVGYLGPNGAGKTTTLRILCGMLKAHSGQVEVAGFDPATDPLEVRSRIGYVPESGALYETLTPLEYLALIGRLYGLEKSLLRRRSRDLLEAFGLAGNRESQMTTFSKGMKQKVVIAAALIHDPQVLFLDEPLNGLDANATLTVKEVVRGLAARGRAVLYSSHLMDVVERVSDRVIILDQGKVVADGSASELSALSGDDSLEGFFSRLTSAEEERHRAEEILATLRSTASEEQAP